MPRKPSTLDHVPGPMEEAAARVFFERGSGVAVEKGWWKASAIVSMLVAVALTAAVIVLVLQQDVHVMQVSKDPNGDLQVTGIASRFTADEDSQMAWASNFASELTEITPALWQRNVERVQSFAVGVATDQVKTYLQRAENNPPQLLNRYPLFVREYARRSVNKVADMTYLVRYELTTRPGPNIAPVAKAYAMTITLTSVGHNSRDDVFRNPSGLAVMNFSISEDIK